MSSRDVIKTPQSLKEIEKFIAESTIDYETASNVHELRLQAYRTAFDAIMEELKTYRPVLAKIKMAYDASLNDAKETKRELDDTRQALLVISEKCEAKLADHKQSQIQQLVEAQKDAEQLKSKIKEYQQDKEWYQAQVDKLKLELSETYKQYRDERDARKILVAELRSQQAADAGEAENKEKESKDQEKESLDPVKLALALDVARQDLTRMTNELFRVKADYGDVVPRRDFEILQAKFEELEKSAAVVKEELEKLQCEHGVLLELQRDVQKERDDYFKQADLLRKDATPRPNWKELAAAWPEGCDDWDAKTTGQSTADHVQFIAKHFQKNDTVNILPVRGLDEHVPRHLRYNGDQVTTPECNTIFNRNFDRVEVSTWIDRIWAAKVAEKGVEDNLADVLLNVLKANFNNCDGVVYEFAYSLDYGLEKFGDEPHIKLFGDILYNRVHESIKYRHDYVIAKARTALSALAAELKRHNAQLDKDCILVTMKNTFPLKTNDDFDQLTLVLDEFEAESHDSDMLPEEQQQSSELGIWQYLFSQDEFGKRSKFLKLLVAQEERAKAQFIGEVERMLDGYQDISFNDASAMLMELDPEANENRKLALSAGFHVKTYQAAKNYDGTIACSRFLEGLANAGVYRSGAQIKK